MRLPHSASSSALRSTRGSAQQGRGHRQLQSRPVDARALIQRVDRHGSGPVNLKLINRFAPAQRRSLNLKSRYKTLAIDKLVTGDGHRLLPRLAGEIAREIQRLAMVQEQIAEIERERDAAPTTCEATERKRDLLSQLKSVGPAISAFLSREKSINSPTSDRWEAFWALPQAPTTAA